MVHIAAESGWSRRYGKALIVQADIVVLGAHRPVIQERPFKAKAGGPAEIGAVAAGEGNRGPTHRHPGTARANPGSTAFAVEEHAIPRIAEAAGRGGQPSIVDSAKKAGSAIRSSCRDGGVRGVRKPIERGLSSDDNAAPELVVHADLAAARKLNVGWRRKRTTDRIGKICSA